MISFNTIEAKRNHNFEEIPYIYMTTIAIHEAHSYQIFPEANLQHGGKRKDSKEKKRRRKKRRGWKKQDRSEDIVRKKIFLSTTKFICKESNKRNRSKRNCGRLSLFFVSAVLLMVPIIGAGDHRTE